MWLAAALGREQSALCTGMQSTLTMAGLHEAGCHTGMGAPVELGQPRKRIDRDQDGGGVGVDQVQLVARTEVPQHPWLVQVGQRGHVLQQCRSEAWLFTSGCCLSSGLQQGCC